MISTTFNQLVSYLGGRGTTFLATMLFIAMFRIGLGFVFKIFRMNVNYRTPQKKQSKK